MARRTDPDDVLDLVRGCASGDAAARHAFQERYAEDIYNFPVKIYRISAESAADFYCYVFERDRIFSRLRTFQGRNRIQFRTFLAYYVLKSLLLEWQRGNRELETVAASDRLEDQASEDTQDGPESKGTAELWAALSPEERLDLKLLSLLEHELTPDDVRLLARVSRRTLRQTLDVVGEVEAGLRRKDVGLSKLRDELDAVWGWIVLRRRELQEIDEKLRLLGADHDSQERRSLLERRQRLEESLARRGRQRERLLGEIRGFKMTTPYKDIARLLNSTVGTVCSRIFRLRQRLERRWQPEEVRQ